jgi:hypothetical protein
MWEWFSAGSICRNVTGAEIVYFEGSAPSFAIEIIKKNVQLRINTMENCQIVMDETGVYVANMEIIAISKIYKVFPLFIL